jgi:phage N-6-adenine-methyltransferase
MKIDSEFRQLIPPLSADEYRQLEQNILAEGCRDALITWNGVILDGHNRYEICDRHGKPFRIAQINLASRDEATNWIIDNQLGRRNITQEQRAYLIGKRYQGEKKQGARTDLTSEQNVPKLNTAEKIGEQHGISHMAVKRNEKFADGVDKIAEVYPEMKQEILQGKSDFSKGEVMSLASEPPEVITAAVEEKKAPHVSHNSGNNEWYTPPEYIEKARLIMGSIDCDPASSEIANRTVKAGTYYTATDDGLTKEWKGNVWMNPPYSQPLIQQFCEKLITEIDNGNIKQACVLVNNATETNWFQNMAICADAIWFIKGRVKFLDIRGFPGGAPLQGQCILYFGPEVARFMELCPGLVCRCTYE